MNSIVFYVDENDYIRKCIYYENFGVGGRKEIIINLPDSRLHNIFFSMIKNNPKTEPIVNKSINIFNFYDVDVNMIDKLIEESQKAEQKIEKKVKRTNKFKKTLIKTSASALAALSIFMISKDIIKDVDFSIETPNLSYSNEILAKDISKDDDLKINSPSKIISFKDNILENIQSFREKIGIDNNVNSYTESSPNNQNLTLEENNEVKKNIGVEENREVQDENEVKENNVAKENVETKENNVIVNNYLRINTEDLVNGEKYNISKAYYSESLSKYANQYGIDPALALAVGTHERGVHNNKVDSGGAIGLFQIQVEGAWNWDNKTITAYNFETNQYEEVLITKDSVSDIFMNMKVGCMMLQNLLVSYDYNVAEAVTAYNYGAENVRHVLETCSKNTGLSINDLNDIDNMDWLKYRDIIKGGDPEYLENVFKYIPNGTILSFTKPNYENVNIEFDNLAYQEKKII